MLTTTVPAVPATARAAVITKIKGDLEIQQVNIVQPADLAPGECLVKVDYAGECVYLLRTHVDSSRETFFSFDDVHLPTRKV